MSSHFDNHLPSVELSEQPPVCSSSGDCDPEVDFAPPWLSEYLEVPSSPSSPLLVPTARLDEGTWTFTDTGFDADRVEMLFNHELPDNPLGPFTDVINSTCHVDAIPLPELHSCPRFCFPGCFAYRPTFLPGHDNPPLPDHLPPPAPPRTPDTALVAVISPATTSISTPAVRVGKRKADIISASDSAGMGGVGRVLGWADKLAIHHSMAVAMSELGSQTVAGPSRLPLSPPVVDTADEQRQEGEDGGDGTEFIGETRELRPAKRFKVGRKGCADQEKVQSAVYIPPGRPVTMQCPCCTHVFSLKDIYAAWEHWDTAHARESDTGKGKNSEKDLAAENPRMAGDDTSEEAEDELKNVGQVKGKKPYDQCPWPGCNFKAKSSTEHQRHFREMHLGIAFLCEQCCVTFARWDLLQPNKHTSASCARNRRAKLLKNIEDKGADCRERNLEDIGYIVQSKDLQPFRKRV